MGKMKKRALRTNYENFLFINSSMNQLAKCDTKITQAEKTKTLEAREQNESESDDVINGVAADSNYGRHIKLLM